MALALGFPWQNGCLQQIAANRFSIPQDVIAILLQGFVRHPRCLHQIIYGHATLEATSTLIHKTAGASLEEMNAQTTLPN